MRCTIWYHLFNLKKLKNTHGGVLILVQLQAEACNFTKINTPPRVFSRFLNCTNGTKSRNASQYRSSFSFSSYLEEFGVREYQIMTKKWKKVDGTGTKEKSSERETYLVR